MAQLEQVQNMLAARIPRDVNLRAEDIECLSGLTMRAARAHADEAIKHNNEPLAKDILRFAKRLMSRISDPNGPSVPHLLDIYQLARRLRNDQATVFLAKLLARARRINAPAP
jgi:hypothetical protein